MSHWLKVISCLCTIDGITIQCWPAKNNFGHGFLQVSPEVFFNIYSKKNGCCDTEIILINLFDRKYWYEVKRQEKGERLEINSAEPLYLLIKTKKIGQADYDKINQSDYEHQWSNLEENKKIKKSFSSILNKKIKDSFKSALRNNIITKKYYNNFENYKLNKKNNFKNNKNLKKT